MTHVAHENISDLNQIHREIDDIFFWHQSALLKNDLTAAKNLLTDYENIIMNHMREEEDVLLPLYRERAGQIRGGDWEIFFLEHKKILEWLNRLKLRLSRLNPPLVDTRDLLALLDDEGRFKQYLEHHSLREDRIFYPEIDRVLDEEEKKNLIKLLTFTLEEPSPIE